MEMIDSQSVAAVRAQLFQIDAIECVVPYGSGHIHDTYKLQIKANGTSGPVLLQRLNTTIFQNPDAVMRNIRTVTNYLCSQFPDKVDIERRVLRLIPTREDNDWLIDNEGSYWRAYRFIEGAHACNTVNSERQAFEAAKAFGTFQALLIDLPSANLIETLPHFHDTPRRFRIFERTLTADPVGRAREASKEIAFAMSRKAVASALVNTSLPVRITHNDTKINNVLLDDVTGEGICVIDLDTVMPGLIAYDFGDMVRTMATPAAEDERDLKMARIDMAFFEAVLRGYLSGAESFLTTLERESLISGAKVIVFEQGLRFLTDFLAGDTYYRISRPEQNLDRCRTQFQLLQSIEQEEGEMVRLLKRQTK